jgi:4-aminobutyrate aminotransferase-like enzyme
VANCGHSHPKVIKAIKDEIDRGLVHSYCFHNEARNNLLTKLREISPIELNKYYLLSTGAEATETCLKLARTWGTKKGGIKKRIIVSFENSFHGRTMGAQLMGGAVEQKNWIGESYPEFVQVPFPDNVYNTDLSFDSFTNSLKKQNISHHVVTGVMVETYQGGIVSFAPKKYIQDLRSWCDKYDALLMFDEIQAGIGRCGKWWGFEHYDVVPDLFAAGKGIGGGMPLSAVIGKEKIMQQYGHGSMTTTHGGNPVCCAAATAAINVVQEESLNKNSEELGKILLNRLDDLKRVAPERIRSINGRGLVAGIHIKKQNSNAPDGEFAEKIVLNCVKKGLLMFAPVGPGGATIKICPPLVITKEAILDGVKVIESALMEEIT